MPGALAASLVGMALACILALARAEADEVSALQVLSMEHYDAQVQRGSDGPQRLVLHSYKDLEYTVDITVGSQAMRAVVDTGSWDFVVFSARCHSAHCKGRPAPQRNPLYSDKQSPTFKDLTWMRINNYGRGDAISRMSLDDVTIGNLRRSNQTFWKAVDAELPPLADGSFEAILGLGNYRWPLAETRSFLEEDEAILEHCWHSVPTDTEIGDEALADCPKWLVKQYLDDRDFAQVQEAHEVAHGTWRFSVCLLNEMGSNGYLVLNDLAPETAAGGRGARPGFVHSMDVMQGYTWSTALSKVSLRRAQSPDDFAMNVGSCHHHSCQGIFETGSSVHSAPLHVVRSIVGSITSLGLKPDCSNIDDMPNLLLSLDGKELTLEPYAYIGKVVGSVPQGLEAYFPHIADLERGEDGAGCTAHLMGIDTMSEAGRPVWIIGIPFFREFYTTFDYHTEIGEDGKPQTKPQIHVAHADDRCLHPSDSNYTVYHRSKIAHVLDLSSVRVPLWVRRGTSIGQMSGRKR